MNRTPAYDFKKSFCISSKAKHVQVSIYVTLDTSVGCHGYNLNVILPSVDIYSIGYLGHPWWFKAMNL